MKISTTDLVLLNELYDLAARADVGCDLCHGNGTWYVRIYSPAPRENYVGKDYGTLSLALECAIKFLRTL